MNMEQKKTILIVDDQQEILDNLKFALENEGFHALVAENASQALAALRRESIDLIISDIAMPQTNGYQLYDTVRRNMAWVEIPFIFLTARALDSDIRYGKELGVDDYITKPFTLDDLLSTIRGKLVRAEQLKEVNIHSSELPTTPIVYPPDVKAKLTASEDEIAYGPLRVNTAQYRVFLNDTEVQLSVKEFALLEALAQAQGNVLSAQDLIIRTHQFDTDKLEAGTLLRPLIRTLRRKLGYDVGEMGIIENVRGIGYRLRSGAEE
jgi:DNA-binding response OmpR family regulator